jgi:hypothetical protein
VNQFLSSRALAPAAFLLGAALSLWSLPAAAGTCDRADLRLARTGKGDRDGDGISNCRERKILHTRADVADTDQDGLDDGDEMLEGCDPHDSDSDHDGTPDGDDDTPGMPRAQKIEAFVDALTCPEGDGTGEVTALGAIVTITATTEFEDASCADLAAALAGGTAPFVEILVAEDTAGALTATSIEADDDEGHEHGDDDDQGDDDQGEDD